MRSLSGTRAVATLAAAMLLIAAEPAELVVRGDGIVPVRIAGTPGTVRIDPAAAAMPALNRDFAARAALKGGMFGVRTGIGPIDIDGRTAVATLDLGGGSFKRRVAWFTHPAVAGADGMIGPGGLEAPVVRFLLHAPRPDERTIALPMDDPRWEVAVARIEIGGQPVSIRFDPNHKRTVATAGAAAIIAAAHGGVLSGPIESTEIAFGVARPIRAMRLKTALPVGPLAITALSVRIADFGSAATIPDMNRDPDEITVTAKGKRKHRHDRISIGRDDLAACSSIVFDKPAHRIRLSCA